MSDRFITFADLKSLKGIAYTRQHIDRLERAGRWPQRVQLGPNRVAWWESEIDERNANLPRGPRPPHEVRISNGAHICAAPGCTEPVHRAGRGHPPRYCEQHRTRRGGATK
jgi:predicted DNA-binding transcriptional regulator AlpA